MLVGIVAKLLKLLCKFFVTVALDLVFAGYGLGYAHTARNVETKNNANVLAG